ncbi:MAG: NADH dehydrogenase (quinone) subunit D [Chloroflexota bacterium]|nr:NADH dehydrogenase (quinone) subunit D [Chloroflexota bacterium]
MGTDLLTSTRPEILHVNLGPQHPATHGVLRVELLLDGEIVVKCQPVIGYLHTGVEKTCENRPYLHSLTLTDRLDYLNPLGNNLAYSLSVEQLCGCEIPERAQIGRVLLAELTRINSHLVYIGSTGLDLGASSVFLYTFREREVLLDLFEELTGARMMTSFIRPGGLFADMPEPWLEKVAKFLETLPSRVDDYENLLTGNPLFKERTIGVGILKPEDALALGVSGPMLRASGVAFDLRKANPYSLYDRFTFDIPTGPNGDCFDRYKVRVLELRESINICRQALNVMPGGPVRTSDRKVMPPPREEIGHSMEALIHHFKLFTEGLKPPAGEAYVGIESPRGELGFFIVSDGSARAVRVHERAPSFANLQAMGLMAEGRLVADLIAVIASIDPILGEVDR